MKKQIKTLIAAGMITIVSAGSIVTSYADCKNENNIHFNYKAQIVYKDSNNTIHKETIFKPSKPETNPETENFSKYQQEVLELVNKERAKVGAKPLKLNKELNNVATIKSQDMIDKKYFDHNSPTYGSPFDMMKKFGIDYKAGGENIAMGQKTPVEVMKSWMNSDGHRKNILNSSYNELGVGIAKTANGQMYWTQMFIGK